MKNIFLLVLLVFSTNAHSISSELIADLNCMGYKNSEYAALKSVKQPSSQVLNSISKIENQIMYLYKKNQKDMDGDEASKDKPLMKYSNPGMSWYSDYLKENLKCLNMGLDSTNTKNCRTTAVNLFLEKINSACEMPLKNFIITEVGQSLSGQYQQQQNQTSQNQGNILSKLKNSDLVLNCGGVFFYGIKGSSLSVFQFVEGTIFDPIYKELNYINATFDSSSKVFSWGYTSKVIDKTVTVNEELNIIQKIIYSKNTLENKITKQICQDKTNQFR
jgi:hypothetical protein